MPREATLFDSADGSVLKGYRLLQRGGANIPPMWIQRASQSRCRLHKTWHRRFAERARRGRAPSRNGESVTTRNVSIMVCACSSNWRKRVRQD